MGLVWGREKTRRLGSSFSYIEIITDCSLFVTYLTFPRYCRFLILFIFLHHLLYLGLVFSPLLLRRPRLLLWVSCGEVIDALDELWGGAPAVALCAFDKLGMDLWRVCKGGWGWGGGVFSSSKALQKENTNFDQDVD